MDTMGNLDLWSLFCLFFLSPCFLYISNHLHLRSGHLDSYKRAELSLRYIRVITKIAVLSTSRDIFLRKTVAGILDPDPETTVYPATNTRGSAL